MIKNRIQPLPPNLGHSRRTIAPRAANSPIEFFENDLPLQGIIKETNNYPPIGETKIGISYYEPLYFDSEGGSSYFEIIY